MAGLWINVLLGIVGSLAGLTLKRYISERAGNAVMRALGLCTLGIGMSNLLSGKDMLCVILCMAVGTVMGEILNIEGAMEHAGEGLKKLLGGRIKDERFVEGFVSATVIFCVGAMAINGSLEAGFNHDYSILVSKSVMDGFGAATFSAAMGIGVAFSALPILIYQGGLTLLAGVVGPLLSDGVINGMTAVGGAIIVGIGLNLLDLGREKIRVGNMLPAIFLPLLYVPLAQWLGSLAGGV